MKTTVRNGPLIRPVFAMIGLQIMTPMERQLDEQETTFYRINSFGSWIVSYQGKIDINALESAFKHLFSRYAVLRAKVREESSGFVLYVPEEKDSPDLIIVDGDRETLSLKSTTLANNRNGMLAIPLLVKSGPQGYISFGIDHTIVDAAAYFSYYSELWEIYTDIVNGVEIERPGRQFLPAAPSEFIPSSSTEVYEEEPVQEPYQLDTGDSHRGDAPQPEPTMFHLKINEEDTLRIIKECKSRGVGVNSLIGGTMATVLRDMNRKRGEVPIKLNVLIDHRQSSGNRVAPTETTYCISRAEIMLKVAPNEDKFVAASELKRQINLMREYAKFGALFSQQSLINEGHADIMLNGIGNIRFNHPNELEFTDFTAFGAWSPGTEDATILNPRGVIKGPHVVLAPYSFNGMLHPWCITFGELYGQSVINDFKSRLIS